MLVLEALLGAVLGGSLVVAAVCLVARPLRLARREQRTERFIRAVAQLGEPGRGRLAMRVGAAYALERLAAESEDLRWPVVDVLTAFLREAAAGAEDGEPGLESRTGPRLAADVRAAVSVLGRRSESWLRPGPGRQIDLGGAQLPGVNLRGAWLEGANLAGIWLEGADLIAAHLAHAQLAGAWLRRCDLALARLEGAGLRGADLRGAQLVDARLPGADLVGARLAGANLVRAQLRGADLTRAQLQDANLVGADLAGARLAGADLRGANLSHAAGLDPDQLGTARVDERTRLP